METTLKIDVVNERRRILRDFMRDERLSNFLWVDLLKFNHGLKSIHHKSFNFTRASDNFNMDVAQLRIYLGDLSGGLVDIKHYDWILDGSRQAQWIEFVHPAWIKGQIWSEANLPSNLTGRNRSIALLDVWLHSKNLDFNSKLRVIECGRLKWDEQIKIDKKFSWINDDDFEEKIEYVWSWMEMNKYSLPIGKGGFSSHDDFLSHLDNFSLSDKELIWSKVYKAWYQKKSRLKKSDVQISLSRNSIKMLDALASRSGFSKAQVVKVLIEEEYSSEHHIGNRLTARKALLSDGDIKPAGEL